MAIGLRHSSYRVIKTHVAHSTLIAFQSAMEMPRVSPDPSSSSEGARDETRPLDTTVMFMQLEICSYTCTYDGTG